MEASMQFFQQVMYIVYAAMAVGVIGVGIWFYRKKKEGGE
jgi:hypothetical protein